MFDKKIYIERREKLKESLKNGVVVFPGNQESPRNYKGNDYHFEQDSTFLYYFGMNVPNLIGVIDIDTIKNIYSELILLLMTLFGWENKNY